MELGYQEGRMNEEVFDMEIRRFLKKVGINAHTEIRHAAEQAAGVGKLEGVESVKAAVKLEVPELGLDLTIDGELKLG